MTKPKTKTEPKPTEKKEKTPAQIRAQERAKEKRAKLKAIREQREAAQETAAIALLNDDAEALAAAKTILQSCDTAEKALTTIAQGQWTQMPNGRWVREITLNDEYRVVAFTDPTGDWMQGVAALKYNGSDVVTASAVALDVEVVKTRLNAMISGMRAIVRDETRPSNPDQDAPQS